MNIMYLIYETTDTETILLDIHKQYTYIENESKVKKTEVIKGMATY